MAHNPWSRWVQWLLALTLPILLLALNLRLVTGHWFVRWEYRRAGFPPDPFGLPTAERIRLAKVCQDFLASNADISLLADLKLPDGEPAFNERELRHMSDVQSVYHGLTIAGIVSGLIWIGGGVALVASEQARERIPAALLNGSLITLGLLTGVGTFMVVSWGEFFTAFHRLFFEGQTWIFPNSDTLIRLFPIRFWIDIAATLVGFLVVEAAALGGAGWAYRWTAARPRVGRRDAV
jgi:integral membrane protein (TIGR01906 family)